MLPSNVAARLPRDAIRETAADRETLLVLHVPVDASQHVGLRAGDHSLRPRRHGPEDARRAGALRLLHRYARRLFRNGLPNVLRREPDFLAELDELLLGH